MICTVSFGMFFTAFLECSLHLVYNKELCVCFLFVLLRNIWSMRIPCEMHVPMHMRGSISDRWSLYESVPYCSANCLLGLSASSGCVRACLQDKEGKTLESNC